MGDNFQKNELQNESESASVKVDYNNTPTLITGNESETMESGIPIYQYAGFWMRFWAYLTDLIIISSLNRIIIYPIMRFMDIPLQNSGIFSTVNIATAVVFYLYFVIMTKYFRQTLGKMIFGLKVIPLRKDTITWDTVLFREWIGRFISASIIVLYVLVAFLPKKQALHDLFADTTVIHER